MEASNVSPLKAWVKRHSPIKSRNKPLPAAPKDEDAGSPTKSRAPMRAISTNISPSKDKGTKRKISGFIRGKPSTSEDAPPLPSQPATKHRRISSVPGKNHNVKNKIGVSIPDGNGSDKQLASRVQHLEEELKAARAELASTSTVTTNKKSSATWRHRPGPSRRAHSFEAHTDPDKDASVRHERLMKGNHYGGLVESLLERDYDAANARAASFASRDGGISPQHATLKSGRHSAMASYGEMENAYMEDDDQEERMRRMRSELRATEWKRIQESCSPGGQRSSSGATKRGRESSAHEEPPARRQKQSHDPSTGTATSEGHRHSRRAASESCAPSNLEVKRSSGIRQVPIDAQPYKIEYVRTTTKKSEEPKGSKPPRVSRTPPKGRPTYDLMKAFGSNTPKQKPGQNENVEVFTEGEDQPDEPTADPKPASPHRRATPSPSKLQTVQEEFEWDDEVF